MCVHGYPRTSIENLGYSGCPWMSMDAYGFPKMHAAKVNATTQKMQTTCTIYNQIYVCKHIDLGICMVTGGLSSLPARFRLSGCSNYAPTLRQSDARVIQRHGCPWTSVDIHGYPWKSIDIRRYLRISNFIHGYPRISLDIQEYIPGLPLIPMKSRDGHVGPWIFMSFKSLIQYGHGAYIQIQDKHAEICTHIDGQRLKNTYGHI